MRRKDFQSNKVVCSTGAPQGTVLAPFIFTLHTADFRYNLSHCYLQKFPDDSAAYGLIRDGDDTENGGLNWDFVDWCQRTHLQKNVAKTKELVVDFGRRKPPPTR